MLDIARRDAPWIWGMHPKNFLLEHAWMHNAKLNQMANNTLKYSRLDPEKRAELRLAWNRPMVWPMVAVLGTLVAGMVPAVLAYRRREREKRR
jgi:hypothetical protein